MRSRLSMSIPGVPFLRTFFCSVKMGLVWDRYGHGTVWRGKVWYGRGYGYGLWERHGLDAVPPPGMDLILDGIGVAWSGTTVGALVVQRSLCPDVFPLGRGD